MSNSYLNIVTFLLTTIFYYLALKPSLHYSLYKDKQQLQKYLNNNYIYLAVYVLLVMVIQLIVNTSIISNSCGGNIAENIGVAGILTFLPWLLIFGVLIVILNIFPGFKSAFADVVGYYYVHVQANKVLTELLINPEIQNKINEETVIDPEKKRALESAADVIIKISGNNSIIINQIVPSNFEQYWKILTPLMKDKYKTGGPEADNIQNDLFQLVVTRDNIGEAMWYIYTGLLITSLVQLKISNRGCNVDPKTMEANYQKFLEQEQKAKEQKEKAATTYTITG